MTRRPPSAALPAAGHSAYGQGYERMRRHAVDPGAVHDRHGSAVVTLRGVAAWLHAFADLPAPPATAGAEPSPGPLPTGVETSAIDILTAMLAVHLEGRTA